jgi:hypothetical protein
MAGNTIAENPKDGLQEGVRTDGNHGNERRRPTQKKPAGKRGDSDLVRCPARKRSGDAPAPRETRKDRSVRIAIRTRLFKSDKAACRNRFDPFRPARIQPGPKHSTPMPREPPGRPFLGVFGLGRYSFSSFVPARALEPFLRLSGPRDLSRCTDPEKNGFRGDLHFDF